MSAGGTGGGCGAHFALAVTAPPGWRSGTHTVKEWVHRHFRQQNTTSSVSERTLEVEIEIASPWGNRIIDTNCALNLPHSFVIIV